MRTDVLEVAGHEAPDSSVPVERTKLDLIEVYKAHFDFVWRTARHLGTDPQHLDDVVQEVFVVVHRRLADFEGRSQVTTWLFEITRRVVAAHLRKSHRRSRVVSHGSIECADSGPGLEARLFVQEDTQLLYTLLDQLDSARREAFVLFELEEMSGPEVAEALGISVSCAYARIRVARIAFEQALVRHTAAQQRRSR
jgi:RNA polymerase sigma-70 factor, ECF subfamily